MSILASAGRLAGAALDAYVGACCRHPWMSLPLWLAMAALCSCDWVEAVL